MRDETAGSIKHSGLDYVADQELSPKKPKKPRATMKGDFVTSIRIGMQEKGARKMH